MTDGDKTDWIDEQVALYLAGALPETEHAEFEAQLAAGWREGERTLQNLTPALRAILEEAPHVVPPPNLKADLLAQLAGPRCEFAFADEGAFVPTPYPGVTMRMLHLDKARRQFSAFLKLAPGAQFPTHHHDGPEECVVLQGELIVGRVRMRPGDYQRADADSEHDVQWSETGALAFVTAPLSMLESGG